VTRDGYLLDNAVPAADARFDAIAELFDASTFRHIGALGIAPGWRCWEVGAGGPTVPAARPWCAASRRGSAQPATCSRPTST
jgi:hypothetical protein